MALSLPTDAAPILLGLLLLALMAVVVPIDLEHRLIPDRFTYPAAAVAFVLGLVLEPAGVPEQLIAAAAAGGFLLVTALANPVGMGLGDVKLAVVMGLCLGRAVAPALLVALVAGALAGAVLVVRHGPRRARGATLAFGPFLALGALVGVLAGDRLVQAYLDAF